MSNKAKWLAVLVSTGVLASCGGTVISSTSNAVSESNVTSSVSSGDGETVAAKGVVHAVEDTRPAAYNTYSPSGEKKGEFASLYKAIDEIVNDVDTYDYNSYITKASGEDATTPIFVNHDKYNDSVDDMFWLYQNNNQLESYVPWKNTYWTDSRDTNATVVYISPTQGPLSYFQGWSLTGVSTTQSSASSTAVWNAQETIESQVIVNMLAFSGITKETYKVDLSKAEIAPAMGSAAETDAFVGFIQCDSYNMSNIGLRCDTSTGDWYYYYGERDMESDATKEDTSKCLMTSTWNDAKKCYSPDCDVTMTLETLKLKDNDGGDYLVDRLSMDFSDGRKAVRDYEFSKITQCGTIRFSAGLDIAPKTAHQLDFMNGSYFKNLVVSSATAYAYDTMQDADAYGAVAQLDPGTYDILNSDPETAARYQTIVYGATASSDFSTAGQDIYNFDFTADTGNGALANAISNVITMIAALPDAASVAAKDSPAISKARTAYDALRTGERDLVSNYSKLVADEAALEAVLA